MYYKKVVKTARNLNEKIIAYKGLHKTLKIKREYEASLIPLKDLFEFLSRVNKKKKRHNQRYVNFVNEYARALWTYDHYSDAKNMLLKLSQQKKKNKRVTLMESYWILGRMSEERGEYAQAVDWFNQALKQKNHSAELKEKIRWYLAWNLRKQNKYTEAANILISLIKSPTTPYVKSKFHFWLADTYRQNNQIELFNKEMEQLAEDDPLGYYGLLAQYKLGQKISPLLTTPTENKIKKSKKTLTNYKFLKSYVNDLLAVGENTIAAQYLAYFGRRIPGYKSSNSHLWTELFAYFARTGNYLKLFTTIGFWKPSRRRLFLKKFPETLFPKPFKAIVDVQAKKWKIEANYIYSIMRQESSFNPEARSPVDAFGVLQLLPKHARKHHKTVGVPYLTATDLFNPRINIPIGTYFLKSLWLKHSNQFILATASYNANDTAIKGWLRTRYKNNDSLSFIEDIPYEETRSYIKLVLRNYIVYSWLDNKQQPIDFPAHFLKISHSSN